MLADTNILIVAPDPEFRQSLGFVLETEGCTVRLAGRLPDVAEPAPACDCIIVDDKSLPKQAERYRCLDHVPRPLILLVDRSPTVTLGTSVLLIEKPILGNELIEAVQSLLGAAAVKPTA